MHAYPKFSPHHLINHIRLHMQYKHKNKCGAWRTRLQFLQKQLTCWHGYTQAWIYACIPINGHGCTCADCADRQQSHQMSIANKDARLSISIFPHHQCIIKLHVIQFVKQVKPEWPKQNLVDPVDVPLVEWAMSNSMRVICMQDYEGTFWTSF